MELNENVTAELNKKMSLQNNAKKALQSISAPVINGMSSFLETSELVNFSKTASYYKASTKNERENRKKLSEELLHPVFQADPKKVAEFFTKPYAKIEMILSKTAYREGFHRKKSNEFDMFRFWPEVSALQAAAFCGDNFLVRKLLSFIIKKENETKDTSLRLKAAEQLQEVLHNKKYLLSFKELINAYDDYLTKYAQLSETDEIARNKQLNEIDELWKIVRLNQKRLSYYGLQEFCDKKSFGQISPQRVLPKFDIEPNRDELSYPYGELTRDDFEGFGIYKALGSEARTSVFGYKRGLKHWVTTDAEAIKHLCKVRTQELSNIIHTLVPSFKQEESSNQSISSLLNSENVDQELEQFIEQQKQLFKSFK